MSMRVFSFLTGVQKSPCRWCAPGQVGMLAGCDGLYHRLLLLELRKAGLQSSRKMKRRLSLPCGETNPISASLG